MKIGLTQRLFISILVATCLAILCMFLIMQWSINREFINYLSTIDQDRLKQMAGRLQEMYAEHENWDFLRKDPRHWLSRLRPERDQVEFKHFQDKAGFPPPPPPDGPGPYQDKEGFLPPPPPGGLGPHFVILDAERKPIFGNLPGTGDVNFKSIARNGKIVGYLGLLSPKHFLDPPQVEFLKRQKFTLILAASGVVLVVAIFSFPMANRLVRPIKAIAAATHDLASGKYSIRVSVLSSDELGQLSRDFNAMALTLESNEKARRHWVADISHELRTPISVLRGEIEALLESIRNITPDAIRSLHAEVLRLQHLVDDLYQLALSDLGGLTYRKEAINLAEVLNDSIEPYGADLVRKDITITKDISPGPQIIVFADAERIQQLFANLIDNSLKYTDAGGELIIRLACSDARATADFEDSAPGVPEGELDRLFDRLYRVEGSRSRSSGGSGLGLAICKNIVEAHGGTISARSSQLGGVLIRVTIPVAGGSS